MAAAAAAGGGGDIGFLRSVRSGAGRAGAGAGAGAGIGRVVGVWEGRKRRRQRDEGGRRSRSESQDGPLHISVMMMPHTCLQCHHKFSCRRHNRPLLSPSSLASQRTSIPPDRDCEREEEDVHSQHRLPSPRRSGGCGRWLARRSSRPTRRNPWRWPLFRRPRRPVVPPGRSTVRLPISSEHGRKLKIIDHWRTTETRLAMVPLGHAKALPANDRTGYVVSAANQSISQSANHSISQSAHQPHQPISQSANRSVRSLHNSLGRCHLTGRPLLLPMHHSLMLPAACDVIGMHSLRLLQAAGTALACATC